jgi:hypothetical protein
MPTPPGNQTMSQEEVENLKRGLAQLAQPNASHPRHTSALRTQDSRDISGQTTDLVCEQTWGLERHSAAKNLVGLANKTVSVGEAARLILCRAGGEIRPSGSLTIDTNQLRL